MKFILAMALVFFVFALASAQSASPLLAMVETEQAFSRMAEEKNTRDAFMAFIADDGLLFRPGAVNGKKWMLEHPVPSSDKRPLLAWQPAFAGIAIAGDLGFTTGPWEFKADIKDEKPSGYGHFVTLWKKQPDGSWKFVVDLGISHPQSGGPQKLWRPEVVNMGSTVRPVNVEEARKILIEHDRAFSKAGLKDGVVKTFVAYAAPDVRLYRNNSLPQIGRTTAEEGLTSIKGKYTWEPLDGDVSRSGDLGYTHGTYRIEDPAAPKKVIEHGSYVHIWRKQAGAWKVVIDVTNAW